MKKLNEEESISVSRVIESYVSESLVEAIVSQLKPVLSELAQDIISRYRIKSIIRQKVEAKYKYKDVFVLNVEMERVKKDE